MTSSTSVKLAVPVFSVALFMSATLMFGIQPMMGKMLLPIVGGSPSGWVTAMAFFQTALLAGYLLAHLLSKFSARGQAILYIIGMIGTCAMLPVSLPQGAAASSAADIFVLLAKTVGLPFVFLSATSSTLQRLFASTTHPAAHDPYFLYAASNLGSMAGLFCYPLLLEPLMGLKAQSNAFLLTHGTIALLAVLCTVLAYFSASGKAEASAAPAAPVQKQPGDRLKWVLLSFVPSSLLMSVTTHIATDVISAPLLWVVPLAIYIGTFIAAFARKDVFPTQSLLKLQLPLIALSVTLVLAYTAGLRTSLGAMLVHLAAFGVTALLCHKVLAASRPSKERLTEFYLMISVGGALGGLLNAFIIPVTLDKLIEYPLFLILSLAFNPLFMEKIGSRTAAFFMIGLINIIPLYLLISDDGSSFIGKIIPSTPEMVDTFLLAALVLASLHPRTMMAGAVTVLFVMQIFGTSNSILTERNFFGIVSVYDLPLTIDDAPYTARYMSHGTTVHGYQIMDKKYDTTPTAYFTRTGPVGQIFDTFKPKKIAVMGLGAGTINCFHTPANEITFIEIDPAVVDVAEKAFTFISKCGKPKIVVGDGRLEIAKLDDKFDLILMDAFSSDTIPTHLITSEALKTYAERLNENGVIGFNLSNRYINLWYSLATTAEHIGMDHRYIVDNDLDEPYAASSQWMTLSPTKGRLNRLEKLGWVKLPPQNHLKPWTDDYTNLLSTMRF